MECKGRWSASTATTQRRNRENFSAERQQTASRAVNGSGGFDQTLQLCRRKPRVVSRRMSCDTRSLLDDKRIINAWSVGFAAGAVLHSWGAFGGVFLPEEYDTDVGKLRHRRPVSLYNPAECSSWLVNDLLREQEVAGSNSVAPTVILVNSIVLWRWSFFSTQTTRAGCLTTLQPTLLALARCSRCAR